MFRFCQAAFLSGSSVGYSTARAARECLLVSSQFRKKSYRTHKCFVGVVGVNGVHFVGGMAG